MIVLDPRQPETARAAADAKLAVARAAAEKTKLDGKLAILAAERDVKLAAEQLALAEAAVKSVRLEGEKVVQAALDAQKLAELDARLTAARAGRLGADLDAARRKLGIQVPVDEIVFIPTLPVRVEEVTAAVGAAAAGPVMSVTDNQLAIDSSLALDAAPLVKPGMPVAIDEQALGIKAKGVVEQVASTPGTRGVDGYHIYFEVRVVETQAKLEGVSLRLTIPIESTKGAVFAVPTSALSLAADGTSRVQVQGNNRALEYVVVKPGLAADGYVEVTPVDGALAPGQLVVVGYKTAGRQGSTMTAQELDRTARVLELRKIGRQYGTEPAVHALVDVDLSLDRGEWLAITGPSGAGKSTLLNIIGCLDRPTSGTYLVDGIDTTKLTDNQRAGLRSQRIGFVFQSFHLLPYRSVLENVMLAEVYRNQSADGRRERALAALERVGLAHRADFLPMKLSGGERQRVAIARALVGSPSLLLCDEPTGNLDSKNTASILDLFERLNRRGPDAGRRHPRRERRQTGRAPRTHRRRPPDRSLPWRKRGHGSKPTGAGSERDRIPVGNHDPRPAG